MSYDVELDRLDVAIKAILTLYQSGKWKLLKQLGIERDREEEMEEMLAAPECSLKAWREADVLAAIEGRAWLVEAAVLLQSRYQAKARKSA